MINTEVFSNPEDFAISDIEAMSDTSTNRPNSPRCAKPTGSIHINPPKPVPRLKPQMPNYKAQLPLLQGWRQGTKLSDLIPAPCDPTIICYHHSSYLVS